MSIPSVFAYTDYRRYLNEWLEARHGLDKRFTRSEMHRRLGLPNTRSYLSDILAGKDISPTFLDRFIPALELTADEGRFFRVLVRFNQAESQEDRELAFDQLVALNRTPRTVLDPKHYLYYRNWWNGAVRAVLAIHDVGDEPRRLAQLLTPSITEGQAKESLELLQELGLIAKDVQGRWKPTEHTLTTGEAAQSELIRQLQVQQLKLIQTAAIKSTKTPSQVIATNTVSVSEQGLELIRKRLERFRSELRSIVHKDPYPASRVHLVSLAIVPLSKALEDAS